MRLHQQGACAGQRRGETRVVEPCGRRVPSRCRGQPRGLGHQVRFRAGHATGRRAQKTAEDPAPPAYAVAPAAAQARREAAKTGGMRFLRPDMAGWLLALPVIATCWFLHDRYVRAFGGRSRIPARFARLSRRTTPLGRGAAVAATLLAAGCLVFALVRPQALIASRTPEFERQDLIVVLDRSASMRAHDIQPSRFRRATLEVRNFLKHKPDAIDRVALVGFADASLVLSYLTSDVGSVFFYLDWVDGDPFALLGTNIGAALNSAREVAQKD